MHWRLRADGYLDRDLATSDGGSLAWNGGEKFYRYREWLAYLLKNFFIPWGVVLNGKVSVMTTSSASDGPALATTI